MSHDWQDELAAQLLWRALEHSRRRDNRECLFQTLWELRRLRTYHSTSEIRVRCVGSKSQAPGTGCKRGDGVERCRARSLAAARLTSDIFRLFDCFMSWSTARLRTSCKPNQSVLKLKENRCNGRFKQHCMSLNACIENTKVDKTNGNAQRHPYPLC